MTAPLFVYPVLPITVYVAVPVPPDVTLPGSFAAFRLAVKWVAGADVPPPHAASANAAAINPVLIMVASMKSAIRLGGFESYRGFRVPQKQSGPARLVKRGARDPGLAGLRDPAVGALLQHVEGHGSAAQHLVVEPADVEAHAQLLLRAIAQLEDL